MSPTVDRQAVDLWRYPDLVVIYLGMRVKSPRGLLTLLSFGRKIHKAVKQKPEGLLLHEDLIYARRFLGIIPAILPIHMGMRQYWSNFDALERWSRSGTHAEWWRRMAKNTRGIGFWHEAYCQTGEMEGVSVNMPALGMWCFADVKPARGSMFSARRRLKRRGEASVAAPVTEGELNQVGR